MSHMDSGTVQDVLPYLDLSKPGCEFNPPGLEGPPEVSVARPRNGASVGFRLVVSL